MRCPAWSLFAVCSLLLVPELRAETIVLRSGNGSPGGPDAVVRYLDGAPAVPLSGAPFDAADFDAACNGSAAVLGTPNPAWLGSLSVDPAARWLGVDASMTPNSALYCHPFELQSNPICRASLELTLAVDDQLGDAATEPNPIGVFVNQAPLPGLSGGGYGFETNYGAGGLETILSPGPNALHLYQRDAARVVAGMLYSARFAVRPYPLAEAGPDQDACLGLSVELDGSSSSHPDCPAGIEYRWLEDGVALGGWSSSPAASVMPTADHVYTLETRCATEPECVADDSLGLHVYPPPLVEAGPDAELCEGSTHLLVGSSQSVPPCSAVEYRWLDGATLVRDWSATPSVNVTVSATTTYTLEARCALEPGCLGSDTVSVVAEDCPLAAAFGSYAARLDRDWLRVSWITLHERDSLGFELWGRRPDGSQQRLAWRFARGSASAYEQRLERSQVSGLERLRIQELELGGEPASSTPWFAIEPETGSGRRLRDARRGD